MDLESFSSGWGRGADATGFSGYNRGMLRELFALLLLAMLIYGAAIRFLITDAGLKALSVGDKIREWLGYFFFLALVAGAVLLFGVHPRPTTAIIAFGVVVMYIVTTGRQFPIFKDDPPR